MPTNNKPFNELLLEQLKDGSAKFELVSSPPPPILTPRFQRPSLPFLAADGGHRFFARIGSALQGISPAMKKVEHYSVQKVTGDGRCLFRALVKGMAINKGIALSPRQERDDADELRMAVKSVICGSEGERVKYEEALIAITVDESLKRYCQRIERPDFWGGSLNYWCCQNCCLSLSWFISRSMRGSWGSGFIPIAEYGAEFGKGWKKGKKPRQEVRLLYSGRNHYDLLI